MLNETATAAVRYDDDNELATQSVTTTTAADLRKLEGETMDPAPTTKAAKTRKGKTVENPSTITDAPKIVYLLQKGDEKPQIVGDARRAAAQAILNDLRLYRCEEIAPDSVFAG